jgi:NAD(P)-dependent dehydrogenase (short-subunit alcohol dehydrogenase family)
LEEVCGWRWTGAVHPEDVAGLLQKWHAALGSGESLEVEARVRRWDGEYRLLLHRKVPLRNERGAILQWYGSSVDIQEQRQAQERILQDERRLSEALLAEAQRLTRIGTFVQRLTQIGSFLFRLHDATEYWSPELFQIFGVDPAKGPPRNRSEYTAYVHPDDRERFLRESEEILAKGQAYGRHDDEGQKLATELRKLGTEAEFHRTDVRREAEVKNLVDQTIARFGRLDIAVNNAGTEGTPGSAADVTIENYQAIFDTNVLGVLLSMKYEIRAMLPQGKGSIVNISSAYGKVGGPTAAVYVGSKHAVEGITKSAAIELAGTGVRVNIVGPGPVETGMFNRFAQTKENKANFLAAQIPNKRIGTPEEIALVSVSLIVVLERMKVFRSSFSSSSRDLISRPTLFHRWLGVRFLDGARQERLRGPARHRFRLCAAEVANVSEHNQGFDPCQ